MDGLINALRDKDFDVRDSAMRALGSLRDNRVVEPILKASISKDNAVRVPAVQALPEIQKEWATESLAVALGNENKHVRILAANMLATLNDLRAIDPLIAGIKDEEAVVRKSSAAGLGSLEVRDYRATESLVVAMKDIDWEVRREATRSLGKINDTDKARDYRVIEVLFSAIDDKNINVRKSAIHALLGIKVNLLDNSPLDWLILTLKDEDNNVCANPAKALAEFIKRTEKALIAALLNPDSNIRWQAIHLFEEIRWTSILKGLDQPAYRNDPKVITWSHLAKRNWSNIVPQVGIQAVEPLLEALSCCEGEMFSHASWALQAFKDLRIVEKLIVALSSQHLNVRIASVITLGNLGDTRALGPIRSSLDNARRLPLMLPGGKDEVDVTTKALLNIIAKAQTLEPLLAGLKMIDKNIPSRYQYQRDDAAIRRLAAEKLGKLKDTRAIEHLIIALKDPAEDVRLEAAYSIKNIGQPIDPEHQIWVEFWIRLATNSDRLDSFDKATADPLIFALRNHIAPYVREKIARELGRRMVAQAVEPLILALKDGTAWNSAAHARLCISAAHALLRIGDPRAIEPLVDAYNSTAGFSYFGCDMEMVDGIGEIGWLKFRELCKKANLTLVNDGGRLKVVPEQNT
ncbi:MAG: HEAT repeat domain-containing protein [Pseudomonadota bacterium]